MKASEYAQWVADNKGKIPEREIIAELGWKFIEESIDFAKDKTRVRNDLFLIRFFRDQDKKWSLLTKMVPELQLSKEGYRKAMELTFPKIYQLITWEDVV